MKDPEKPDFAERNHRTGYHASRHRGFTVLERRTVTLVYRDQCKRRVES